jgi:hypothetical protein
MRKKHPAYQSADVVRAKSQEPPASYSSDAVRPDDLVAFGEGHPWRVLALLPTAPARPYVSWPIRLRSPSTLPSSAAPKGVTHVKRGAPTRIVVKGSAPRSRCAFPCNTDGLNYSVSSSQSR